MKFRFTELDAGRHQGKTLTLADEGKIAKKYADPATYWTATIKSVETLEELQSILIDWPTGLVLTTGTPPTPLTGKIRRTKENLPFNGAGLTGFDLDELAELCRQNRRDELKTLGDCVEAIRSIHPALKNVGFVATTSSSSFVNGGPLKGVHLYALTTDTALNPDVLEALHLHATASNWGRYYVSGSGVLLHRSLIDTALKTPCQPIFEGKPIEGEGVKVVREVELFPGEPLAPGTITADEETSAEAEMVWEGWRHDSEILAEMVEKRGLWVASRVREGMDETEARSFAEKVSKGGRITLPLGLTITMNTGDIVRVKDLMENPKRYDGKSCRDPLDPDYGSGKATIHTNGKIPTINSFAHGGMVYELPGIEALCLIDLDKAPEEDRIEVLEEWGAKLSGLPISRREKFMVHLKQRGITKKVAESIIKLSPAIVEDNGDEDTEMGVAETFAGKYATRARYDHEEGIWYGWNGNWWERDEVGRAKWRVREICKVVADGSDTVLKHSFVVGALKLAEIDPSMAVKGGSWNPHPDLLGTPGGTVELKTGTLRAPAQADMITHVTAVAPEKGEPVKWLRFLREIMLGDDEMVSYLQLVLGYAITGEIREESFYVLAGRGGNGKGTMLEIVQKVIGNELYKKADASTFTVKNHDRHPADKEFLKGSRLVVCSETEDGKSWDEATFKDLSAPDGGIITSRGMNANFGSWKAQHTILFATNFIPHLKNEKDDSMERRLHIIPFEYRAKTPNRSLKTQIPKEEGPQILAWLVDGARKWYELTDRGESIPMPLRVQKASGLYFKSQDRMGEFFASYVADNLGKEGATLTNKNGELGYKATSLFNWWKEWAREAGEAPGTQKDFGGRLVRRFDCVNRARFTKKKVTVYTGIDEACEEARLGLGEGDEDEHDEEFDSIPDSF